VNGDWDPAALTGDVRRDVTGNERLMRLSAVGAIVHIDPGRESFSPPPPTRGRDFSSDLAGSSRTTGVDSSRNEFPA
jgi:hypothetical protein